MGIQQTAGVLAVQGAFIEHERRLEELGARCVELRQARDLEQPFDRLVLPGGESTVQAKLLRELEMFEPLRERIVGGMPVLATCAGLILLAERVEGATCPCPGFGTLPVTVRRNAYGRQLGSFTARAAWREDGARSGAGRGETTRGDTARGDTACNDAGPTPLPMTFIRAPKIVAVGPGVEVLASVDGGTGFSPAAVRYGNQVACAFHPELDADLRVHRMFLGL